MSRRRVLSPLERLLEPSGLLADWLLLGSGQEMEKTTSQSLSKGFRWAGGGVVTGDGFRASEGGLEPKRGMSSHWMRQALKGIPVCKVSRYVYVDGQVAVCMKLVCQSMLIWIGLSWGRFTHGGCCGCHGQCFHLSPLPHRGYMCVYVLFLVCNT